MQSPEAKRKNLDIRLVYDDSINKYLIGDALRVHQIITNLLSNSIKFTEEGFVEIRVACTERTNQQQTIQIQVQDTGIGMDSKNISKIFRSYEQETNQTDRKYGGTGLGLAIVSEILQKMNGSIDVQSQKNSGSTFTVTIPFLTETKKVITPNKPNLHNINLQNVKVLIVEDNTINMMYTQSILSKYDCIIDKASNGHVAIEKCKTNQYDIILMDLQMPELDGISATEILRNELKIQTPIIAQTANTIQKDVNRCFEVGMNDYLPKPYSSQDLIEKMTNFIKIHSSSNVAQAYPSPLKESTPKHNTKQTSSFDLYKKVMKLVDNDMDEAFDILETIQSELPIYFSELQDSYLSKDIEQFKKAGHKLKSTFRLFRINQAFTICLSVEMIDENNVDLSSFESPLNELSSIVDLVLAEIKVILG